VEERVPEMGQWTWRKRAFEAEEPHERGRATRKVGCLEFEKKYRWTAM